MSMNVFITGKRNITVDKTGEKDTQTIIFNALQTRTNETYNIIQSDNPIESYRKWVREQIPGNYHMEPVYDIHDILGDGEPVEYHPYNFFEEHLNKFNKWVDVCEKKGYNVTIEMI